MMLAVLLLEVVTTAVLAAAGYAQHAGRGVERELLALCVFLTPLHVARWFSLARAAKPPSFVLSIFELLALTAAFSYPVPWWGVALALLTALSLATGSDDSDDRAGRLVSALGSMVLVAVLAELTFTAVHGYDLSIIRAILFAPVLVEGFHPRRLRGERDVRRRGAAVLVHAGSALGTDLDIVYPLLYLAAISAIHLSVCRLDAPERARVRRARAMRVTFAAIVAAFPLFVGEIAFKIVPNRYSELVPVPKLDYRAPGAKTIYQGAFLGARSTPHEVTWNSRRYHDVDHELRKPPGTVRVLVLGDSYIEAVQVPLEATLHRRIETQLSPMTDQRVE